MNRLERLQSFLGFAPASSNGNGVKLADPPEAKAIPIIDPRIYAQFVPIDGNGRTTKLLPGTLDWYAVSWLAYACMRYRAQKLIEAPMWIAEEQDGEEKWLEGDHELAELLERPNPDMEMSDLLELASLYLDSTGACLVIKSRDRSKRVGALYPFSGEDFRVETADGRLHGKFRVRTSSGEKEYGPDDVLYFRNANPADPHGHVAPLHAALDRLGIDRQLVESLKAGLRNSIVPGMMLEFPPEIPLTSEQLEEFLMTASAKYADAKNHGKMFASNARARQGVLGFQGLNGGELAKEIEASVCASFQLPPVVISAFVGLVNSSDRHNLDTSIRLVYDNATIPTWSRLEKGFTRGLLREVDPNPLRFIRFDKSKVKGLQDDRTAQAEIVSKAAGALRVDDARVMLGLEPLEDERGEQLMGSAAPVAVADPPKTRLQRKAVDERALRWAVHDAEMRAAEFGWELEALSQLDQDKELALSVLISGGKTGQAPTETKDPPPPIGPADAETIRRIIREIAEKMDLESAVRWTAAMQPLIEQTGRRAVERVSADVGISFDLLQPGLLEYTQKEAAFLVTSVTNTTKQAIRDALSAGLVEGESIPDLAKRIQESGAFARSRAELIARTEVTRVSNGGQRASLQAYAAETGDVVKKSWLSARDARVRDTHRAMDGETALVDAAFSNGLQEPSEPNCRCTLTYELEAAA